MAKSIASVNVAANATFQTLIDTVNLIANTVTNEVVTVNVLANGALTTGNGFVDGIFGGTTLVANTVRGGTLTTTSDLTVSSNLVLRFALTVNNGINVGNSTVNSYVNSSILKISNSTSTANLTPVDLKIGTTVVNSSTISVGSQSLNSTTFSVGNSTVNSQLTQSNLTVGESVVSNNNLKLGNSTVNSTINSISLIIGTSVVVNSSTITIGSSTLNTIAILVGGTSVLNTTAFSLGNSTVNVTANTSSFKIGANVIATTSQLSVGNSTVNTVINSTAITLGSNLVANTTKLTVGNVAINTTAITINGSVLNNTPSVSIANVGTVVGTRPKINFSGSGIIVSVTDEPSNNQVTVNFTANGGLSVGGSNTFIQINDNGALGGFSALSFDKTSNTLSVANIVSVPVFISSNISRTETGSKTIAGVNIFIDTIYNTDHRSAEYLVSITDNTTNEHQVSKLLVVHDGTSGFITEYGSLYTNNQLGSFDLVANTTTMRVRFNTSVANGALKYHKTLLWV